MVDKKIKLKPKIKLWLSSDNNNSVFGEGKWKLLTAIDKYSSIKKSSDALKISYKKAWSLIKNAEENLGLSLVIKQRGGIAGGVTKLTENGRLLADAFSKYRTRVYKYSDKIFIDIFKPILNKKRKQI